MKIEGFDWIDMSSAVGLRQSGREPPVKAPPEGVMSEVRPTDPGSVELYLTQDGTLIRLENADRCSPLGHACLLE